MFPGSSGGIAAVELALLALAAISGSGETASLSSQPIPAKDKKSPEVIYYERAADDSRIDKRLDKVAAAPAEPAAWTPFRGGPADARVRAMAPVAGGRNRQLFGSPAVSTPNSFSSSRSGDASSSSSETADKGGVDALAGYVDKSLLAEALMQMLIEELDGDESSADRQGGGDVAQASEPAAATDDIANEVYEANRDGNVDESAAEDAEEAEYEASDEATEALQALAAAESTAYANGAVEHGDAFAAAAAAAPPRRPTLLGQAANFAAAGAAAPRRSQRPSSADSPKAAQTTAAPTVAVETADISKPNDGEEEDAQNVVDSVDAGVVQDDKDDSREDKRVRVEVSGGVLPQSSATGPMAATTRNGGKAEQGKSDKDGDEDPDGDPYRDYLNMWYKANIAEDYEDDSLERLRNYLEYMKLSKNRLASEKKPRGGVSGAAAGSSATSRNTQVASTPLMSAGRKKRSLPDDGGLLVYDAPQRASVLPADGVYLSSGEAARLRQFIIDLNEQNNKYEAVLRGLLSADDAGRDVGGRARFANAAFDRSAISAAADEARNKNLYRLAYGLADPYRLRGDY